MDTKSTLLASKKDWQSHVDATFRAVQSLCAAGRQVTRATTLLLALVFFSFTRSTAQSTTISTNLTGSTSTSTNSFVTFVVQNNSGSGILLTDVASYSTTSYNGLTAELWYSTTSLSGPVTLSTPNFTQITTGTVTGITGTGINTWLSGMSFLIPSGATYRFALKINGTSVRYSSSGTNNYTAAGVTLYIGNHQISGQNVGYVLTLNPRYFAGSITFEPAGPPCPAPSGLSATNITSTSANLSWTPVGGSQGYEYALTTTATQPTTTTPVTSTSTTSFSATGLTPSTTYYLHVRNECSPPLQAYSPWVTYQFETNPPCTQRGIIISNVTTSSADIKWNTESHASQYEYVLKTNTTVPSSGNMTPDSMHLATGLNEGTTYYFFVRMHCPGDEQSDWAMDSFTTRTICRPPTLNVDHIEANRGIVYWEPVPTAVEYEYEISQSPTPLGEGTTIKATSFYAFPLKDGQTYYFHVRSRCDDQGFESKSEWTTTAFSTFPTSVSNVNKDFGIAVYPNPAKDAVTLNVQGKDILGAKVSITDLNGRTVYQSDINTQKSVIDLSQLSPGIYMMRYADNEYSEIIKLTKE